MPECQGKNCRCRTNFFRHSRIQAFPYDFSRSCSKHITISSCLRTCRVYVSLYTIFSSSLKSLNTPSSAESFHFICYSNNKDVTATIFLLPQEQKRCTIKIFWLPQHSWASALRPMPPASIGLQASGSFWYFTK
jgi:hypothetical protein